jgi:hypothetical protein
LSAPKRFLGIGGAALLALAAVSLSALDLKKVFDPANKKFKAKQPTQAAGVRGLDEPGEEGDLNARDRDAVAWIASRRVPEDELRAFVSEGALAPLP